MNTTHIKILVSVFAGLAIWRVFELPGASDAFWSFITIGAIPGTDKILGTDTLLRALCILFAVIFFLVFRKEFMASLPRRAPKDPVLEVVRRASLVGKTATAAAAPVFTTRNRIIITLAKQQDRPAFASVRPVVVGLGRAAAWIIQLTCWVETDCRRAAKGLAKQARGAYKKSVAFATRVVHWVYRCLLVVGRYIVFASIIAWKLAEPHVRSFDRWLDKQLHTNKSTAEVLRFANDVSRATANAYRRAEQSSRNLRGHK